MKKLLYITFTISISLIGIIAVLFYLVPSAIVPLNAILYLLNILILIIAFFLFFEFLLVIEKIKDQMKK